MNVIVVGAGTVGASVARVLSNERHDVTLIDQDAQRLSDVQERLDIMTVEGNGAAPRVLDEAGVRNAELLIAATHSDEVNMIACAHAKAFGVQRTVARLKHPDYLGESTLSSQSRGIDHVINPTEAAKAEIARLLEHTWAIDVADFAQGKVEMMGMRLGESDPLVGKTLAEIGKLGQDPMTLGAVVRDGELIVPRGRTVLHAGDTIYVIGQQGSMTAMSFLMGHPDEGLESLGIFGGSRLGLSLAKFFEDRKIETRLIEYTRERATRCAAELGKTLVINGDATDVRLLREEKFDKVDGFVAASENNEMNLLTAAVVHRLGVPKTIAVFQREDYGALAYEMGISTTVTVTSATADAILKFVRSGSLRAVTTIVGGKAEIHELVVPSGCRIANERLADAAIPEGIVVGAVVSPQGEVEIARGSTVLVPGSTAVVVVVNGAIEELAGLFGESGQSWSSLLRRR